MPVQQHQQMRKLQNKPAYAGLVRTDGMVTHPFARVLMIGAILSAIGVVAGLGMQLGRQQFELLLPIIPFLVGFSCFKGALAIDAKAKLAAGGEEAARLCEHHGTEASVRHWVVYKFSAMFMGLAATVVCIIVLWARSGG